MEQAKIHLYHGEGKGKTTAAIGLAIRAAGAGKSVFFTQFMKGNPSAEIAVLKSIPGITVMRPEKEFGFYHSMSETEKEQIRKQHNAILTKIDEARKSGNAPDVLVLDEVTHAYRYRLLDRELIERLLQNHEGIEIVMTGRDPDPLLFEYADYVTEMNCEKHPYESGLAARKGIEY